MITRELKGKINANGRLFIERKGEMKPQECNYRERTCGDFCPHFGEPRSTDNSKDPEDDAKTELFICGGSVLIFDKLDDQRGTGGGVATRLATSTGLWPCPGEMGTQKAK